MKLNSVCHTVSDRQIEARLLQWMLTEANHTNWWVCGATHDGKVVCWDSAADRRTPYLIPKDRQYYAVRVLSKLHELGLPGTWLVGWIDDCKRFYLLWKDDDGDIQIPIECDRSWLSLREWDMDTWASMAMTAYLQWQEMERVVDASPNQRFSPANGEQAPSLTH